MKLSQMLSLGLTVAGSVAAGRLLRRRHDWEKENKRVAVCVDFDDAQDAAIRAGLGLEEMLSSVAKHGATHVSLPELTLDRLLVKGRLAPQAPANPLPAPAPVGHWNYLYGSQSLVRYLAEELCDRLPYTEARILGKGTLAFAGNLPTIGQIGLGFERETAGQIRRHGLGVVPRPVSYAWPEPALIERTLAQAAQYGRLVAFADDMILGHEMHLDATLSAMEAHGLSLVYFAQSRHQKGDWFVAKRRAPHVVLGHRFSPQEMIPLDYHAAAHNWAHLARERGIRFCYVNFFRVLHATEPLEGLDYLQHARAALEDEGFTVSGDATIPSPAPQATAGELALTGLAPAGIAAGAASRLLDLPEALATPLTVATAGGALALPYLEQVYKQAQSAGPVSQPDHQVGHGHGDHHHHNGHHHHYAHEHDDHSHHHHHREEDANLQALYPPSYTPKLLALAASSLAPVAAGNGSSGGVPPDLVAGWIFPAGAATTLAAVTGGQEYLLRIEEYRGFGLDWLLPLLGAGASLPHPTGRRALLMALVAGWLAARRLGQDDFLAHLDAPHALGHTHHISAAMRLAGDVGIWLGPRPARKWAGLGPLAQVVGRLLERRGHGEAATVFRLGSALAYTLSLVAFRRPERALSTTARQALPSFALGAALGTLLLEGERR